METSNLKSHKKKTAQIRHGGTHFTWTLATQSEICYIQSVAYGNGKYVYATNLGQIFYSSDCVTWTVAGIPSIINFDAVAYGSGKFIAMDRDGTGNLFSNAR
jgi:hypothetical protein